MTLKVEVSIGEFLDKMSILEIKNARIKDEKKLTNIRRELAMLKKQWAESPYANGGIEQEYAELIAVNELLWDIEEGKRECERQKRFDEQFIQLARDVYIKNDKRAAIKRIINEKLNSGLIEEKSYAAY